MATYTETRTATYASGDLTVSDTVVTLSETATVSSTGAGNAGVSETNLTLSGTETAPPTATGGSGVGFEKLTFQGTETAAVVAGADGVRIPTGNFRAVTVYVEDTEGKPLKSAEWVQSAGLFPTAARVEETPDGRMAARLWLLEAAYQEFAVIADAGRDGVDFVWYQQTTDDGPAVGSSEREATLRFAPVEVGGENNLSVGFGASIGGS